MRLIFSCENTSAQKPDIDDMIYGDAVTIPSER